MATSGISIRLKRLRQRFGLGAPKLAIRTHVAWYWRILIVVAILVALLASAAWIYEAGRRAGGYHTDRSAQNIQSLRSRVMELETELTQLRSLAETGESSLQIERAALRQLSQRVRMLEQENASLKEDLVFFEGLMPTSEVGGEIGVRINHLRIDPSANENEYLYSMLVINNGGRHTREIRGSVQLEIRMRKNGKDAVIVLPSENDPNPAHYRFEIRYFRRLVGDFSVPAGATVKSVEVRLLQDGNVRARQSVTL